MKLTQKQKTKLKSLARSAQGLSAQAKVLLDEIQFIRNEKLAPLEREFREVTQHIKSGRHIPPLQKPAQNDTEEYRTGSRVLAREQELSDLIREHKEEIAQLNARASALTAYFHPLNSVVDEVLQHANLTRSQAGIHF